MAEIEEIMSRDIKLSDYPTSRAPEYKALVAAAKRKFEELKIGYPNERLRENFLNAVNKYISRRVMALRHENDLRNEIMTRGELKESDRESMGAYLFESQTGENSKGLVLAEQKEGYFLIFFENSDDYYYFKDGEINNKKSGGVHRAMRLAKGDIANVLLINGDEFSYYSWGTVLHERQHFLNDVAFGDFAYTESGSSDYRLRKIKNEVLAFLRDGSSAEGSTDFLDNYEDLYGHLMDAFKKLERRGVEELMKEIKGKLLNLLPFFPDDSTRAQLVYQLIDVPLDRFPEMLDRMVKYYKRKEKNKEE